jgi:protein-S-isoprenylcysteine O-methyltransferase Ste14
MIFIYLGIIAFIFMFLYDFYTLRNERRKKSFFGIIGLTLFICSAIMLIVFSTKIIFPIPIVILALLVSIISCFLLAYSLFLELPFTKTYANEKHNDGLVVTGTYALCRHPGVIWFGILFVSLFFLTGAILLIPATIIWTSADILYVYIQEKYIFPRMFNDYDAYIKATPMIIPDRQSIIKCKNTVFRGMVC